MDVEKVKDSLIEFCNGFDTDCSGCPFFFEDCNFSGQSEKELEKSVNIMNDYLEVNGMKAKRYVYVNLPLKSGAKNYLFCVPEGAEVAYGDTLVCKTYNGHELEGTAVSNPVALDDTFLSVMKQELGIKGDIQPVVGKHTIQRF